MQSVPSILGGKASATPTTTAVGAPKEVALRKRLNHEAALREAATAARAKALWARQWEATTAALPLVAHPQGADAPPVGTGAVYTSIDQNEFWSKASWFGLPRKKLLLYAHTIACVVHTTLCIVCIVVTSQATDPYLSVVRQRFVFTRNTTECGRLTNFTASGKSDVLAVLVESGKVHVGVASAMFFLLSSAAHATWMLACRWAPLGNILLPWLADAFG